MKDNLHAPNGAFISIIGKLKSLRFYILAVLVCVIMLNLVRIVKIVGDSMEPTLYHGDRVIMLVNNIINTKPSKGDIVIFKKEEYSDHYLIKRVIGTEGDLVEVKNNSVYLNGDLIEESYADNYIVYSDVTYKIGEGQLFVLGDNRCNSADSRISAIGLIDCERDLIGKMIYNVSKIGE